MIKIRDIWADLRLRQAAIYRRRCEVERHHEEVISALDAEEKILKALIDLEDKRSALLLTPRLARD
jgi:hypothetical protein